ncbi:hypothetical protein OEZ86_002705 [Tetradesmus obliquus]|nr:hypothetical protein OEZ86_002705 [Tetradesmus obliquus]
MLNIHRQHAPAARGQITQQQPHKCGAVRPAAQQQQQLQRAARLLTRANPKSNSSSTATKQDTSSSSSSSSQVQPGLAGGLLSSPQQQSAAYNFLTGTSVAFGVAALAAPQLLLTLALGVDATPLDVAFTRIAGATMAISAAVEYSLQDAVVAGHLKSSTYQRLMLAILGKNCLYLAAFALSPGLWSPVLFSFYPTAAAASIVINAATLCSGFAQSGAASIRAGLASVAGFSEPKTPAGWTYSVFILLYAATVAACYAPEVIFTGQPMTAAGQLLKHTWAPGFLLAGAACWVLADAADRGRLGASTFRRLNLGLAAVEAGYTAVFGWSIASGLAVNDGSSWSNLAGSAGITLYCLYQYVTNDKSEK